MYISDKSKGVEPGRHQGELVPPTLTMADGNLVKKTTLILKNACKPSVNVNLIQYSKKMLQSASRTRHGNDKNQVVSPKASPKKLTLLVDNTNLPVTQNPQSRPSSMASPIRPSTHRGIRGRGGMGRAALYHNQSRPTTVNYVSRSSGRSLMYSKRAAKSENKSKHQIPKQIYDQNGKLIQKRQKDSAKGYPKTVDNFDVAVEGSRRYHTYLMKICAAVSCYDNHINKLKSMVNHNDHNEMIVQLERARDVITSALYSNKESGLKIDKRIISSSDDKDNRDSAKNRSLLYLSKRPWSVLAKEMDIKTKRILAKLEDIEKDNTYQFKNLTSTEEKIDYIKKILCLEPNEEHTEGPENKGEKKDSPLLSSLENPWDVFNKLTWTEEDRYKLLVQQFETLPRNRIAQFYELLWSKCLGRDADSQDDDGKIIFRKDRRRDYEAPTTRQRQEKNLMPWQFLEADLPKLREMDEEDEQNYGFVNLDMLQPLIGKVEESGIEDKNTNIHLERRAIIFHVMKCVKAGEGGLYEAALLQNTELRKRLNASAKRIKFLEKQNEETFKTAEAKIQKNAAMIDAILHRNKNKVHVAQEEAQQAKVEAVKLNGVLKSLKIELERTKTNLKQTLDENKKHQFDLRKAKKANDEISFQLKTKYYEKNKQPSLWELTGPK